VVGRATVVVATVVVETVMAEAATVVVLVGGGGREKVEVGTGTVVLVEACPCKGRLGHWCKNQCQRDTETAGYCSS
jgi:hypothetical protein